MDAGFLPLAARLGAAGSVLAVGAVRRLQLLACCASQKQGKQYQ